MTKELQNLFSWQEFYRMNQQWEGYAKATEQIEEYNANR